jgi:hypothetical protein
LRISNCGIRIEREKQKERDSDREESMIKKSRFLFLFPPDFGCVNCKSAIRNAKCAILLGALLFAVSI